MSGLAFQVIDRMKDQVNLGLVHIVKKLGSSLQNCSLMPGILLEIQVSVFFFRFSTGLTQNSREETQK